MKRRVKINMKPSYASGGNLANAPWRPLVGNMSQPNVSVNSTIKGVERSEANLEAEAGEVVTVPGKGGIPSTFKIGGSRHSSGGTPLNLPKDSFIYSDTKAMRIKDPKILAQFGMGSSPVTPADIAKKYDINKFKQILLDPDNDDLQKKTAEGMIANYNLKLAKLALLQESMKGFPQGIPVVAMPYIEQMEIDPSQFAQMNPSGGQEPDVDDAGQMNFGGIIGKLKSMKQGGQQDYFLPKAQNAGDVDSLVKRNELRKQKYLEDAQKEEAARSAYYEETARQRDIGMYNTSIKKQEGYVKAAYEILKGSDLRHFDSAKKQYDEALSIYNNQLNQLANLQPTQTKLLKVAAAASTPRKKVIVSAGDMFRQANTAIPVPLDQSFINSFKFGGIPQYKPGGETSAYNPKDGMIYYKVDGKLTRTKKATPEEVAKYNTSIKTNTSTTNTPVNTKSNTTQNTSTEPYIETDLNKLFNGDANILAHYQAVEKTFRDNPKIAAELVTRTRKAMLDKENYKGKSGRYTQQFTPEEVANFKDEDILNNFLELSKRNLALLAHDGNAQQKYGDVNDDGNTNKKLRKRFNEIGIPLPNDSNLAKFQQATYLGYNDLIKDKDTYEDPEINTALTNFTIGALGPEEETINVTGGKRQKTVSPIDGAYTDNTSRQIPGYTPPKVTPAVKDKAEDNKELVTQADQAGPEYQGVGAPWWLQDVIKTAHAAGNLARIKKYQPWQATPDVVTPELTFFDPTRELAANAEQSRIAADSLAQFTGPQAFNARFNQIQGQGFKNAADIMSRYQNQNVQVSNQQAVNNANTMNQASQQKAQLATGLWDKYQTVNQMFDNSKSQARDALVNQYTNAITNKNYTANLNTVNPQFAIDPSIGGRMYQHDPRVFKPSFTKPPDIAQMADDLLAKHPALFKNPYDAYRAAKDLAGLPQTPEDPYMQQQNPSIPQPYDPNQLAYPGI